MPLVQDRSFDLLTSSPAHYHCATDATAIILYNLKVLTKNSHTLVGVLILHTSIMYQYILVSYTYCLRDNKRLPIDWIAGKLTLSCTVVIMIRFCVVKTSYVSLSGLSLRNTRKLCCKQSTRLCGKSARDIIKKSRSPCTQLQLHSLDPIAIHHTK